MMRNTWETGHTHTTEIVSDNHSHKFKDNRSCTSDVQKESMNQSHNALQSLNGQAKRETSTESTRQINKFRFEHTYNKIMHYHTL